MNNQLSLYTNTPPLRLYLKIAVPGAIGMIAASLWGLLDGIFVGQLLGETAFAALNLAFPFVMINFSLADLVGVGSSVLISIALGRQENEEANNIFSCACILVVLAGGIMGVLLYAIAPWLMAMLGATGELADLGALYIRANTLLSPFTTIVFATDNYLRICGRVKTSMWLNVLMTAVILVLEFVLLGVLNLGFIGSPLAVNGGMMICGILSLYPFLRGKLSLKFRRPRFTLPMLWQIVAAGSPVFLSNVSAHITGILFNTVLLKIGGAAAVTVYGVLMYAGDILRMPLYGACDSLQPAIGYNWGAGNGKRVMAIARCCLTAAALISFAGSALMFFFPRQIAAMFLTETSPEVAQMTVRALKIYATASLTRWLGFSIQSFLIALDKPTPATVLSVSNAFVLPVVLLGLLWPLGLDGVWLNTPINAAIVSAMALFMLRKVKFDQYTKG